MENELSKEARFFKLYNSVHLRLYSYIMTVVHNYGDADDILQETALVLWEKFDQFQEGTSFGAWAVAIARNMALQFMQKNKRTRMIFGEEFYTQVSDYSQENTSDVSHIEKALNNCIVKLSDNNQKLLSLRYKKNVPIKRISQLTGRSANALYQNFWKITQVLRICIQRQLTCQET